MTYLRLAGLLGGVLLLIGAFFYGQHDGKVRCEAKHLADAAKAAKTRDAQIKLAQKQDEKLAAADVERETIVREITREVPRIVDRPVYRNVCVDGDGVRVLAKAVAAANGGGAASGRPAGDAAAVRPAPIKGR